MKPTLLPVFLLSFFPNFLTYFFFPGTVIPLRSYDKPTAYFSVYFIIIFYLLYYYFIIIFFSVYGSLCTRTNGVTPVEFCCEASVLDSSVFNKD